MKISEYRTYDPNNACDSSKICDAVFVISWITTKRPGCSENVTSSWMNVTASIQHLFHGQIWEEMKDQLQRRPSHVFLVASTKRYILEHTAETCAGAMKTYWSQIGLEAWPTSGNSHRRCQQTMVSDHFTRERSKIVCREHWKSLCWVNICPYFPSRKYFVENTNESSLHLNSCRSC